MTFLEKFLQDPIRRRAIKRWSYVVLFLIVAAEVALPWIFGGGHGHFSFENLPAFGSLYGLISCVAIIVLSKLIGKLWLLRREDYYDS
jgi:hypothetical protein